MLSNAYFLAKFRFDTAENEPAKNICKTVHKFRLGAQSYALATSAGASVYVGLRELAVRGVAPLPLAPRIVLSAGAVVALVERFDVEPFIDFSAT